MRKQLPFQRNGFEEKTFENECLEMLFSYYVVSLLSIVCVFFIFFLKKFDLNPEKNLGNTVLKLVSKYSRQRFSFGWIHLLTLLKFNTF